MNISRRTIILFLLPACVFYFGFLLLPTLSALYYSLFDWSGFTTDMQFIGLKNFQVLLNDDVFWRSLGNTMKILVLGGAITFFLAFLLAYLLNSGIKGKKFFRAIIFLPNVIATIALTTMWINGVYGTRGGILPEFFKAIYWEPGRSFLWLSIENVFNSILIALIWISVGYYVVLFLAGMDKIPRELYEAAELDGATKPTSFFRITIPLMWDVITVAIILWTITAIKVFEFPFAFVGVEGDPSGYTVGIYLYQMGFGSKQAIYKLGYATAMGVVMLLAVIAVSIVVRRVLRREAIQY
jgi:ABC-type sugar transport system permease subunit